MTRESHDLFEEGRPLLTARDVLRRRWKRTGPPRVDVPALVVLCLQSPVFERAGRRHGGQNVRGFFGRVKVLQAAHGRVALASVPGVGAPGAVLLFEELVAFGVRRFLLVGPAGGLAESLAAGDVVACEWALRGEGTSRYYLAPAERVAASVELTERAVAALVGRGIACRRGGTWTTDAPYRETEPELRVHQQAGALTVDMEAAGCFAAAQGLGAGAGAMLVVADRLAGGQWHPPLDDRGLTRVQLSVVAALVDAWAGEYA